MTGVTYPQSESEPNDRRDQANEILDERDTVVEKGFVGGEPVRVMEGSYRLRLHLEPEPLEVTITVKPVQKSSFTLQKEKDKWIISER